MPMPSGFGAAVILSGSMEPELSIDDLIIVKKSDNYDVGDIVVYQRNYELIVHRIVEINGNNVITKGDANNIEDDPISKKQIIGKVVHIARNICKYVKVITEPIVFVPFFITILLFNFAFSGSEKERSVSDEKKISSSEEN